MIDIDKLNIDPRPCPQCGNQTIVIAQKSEAHEDSYDAWFIPHYNIALSWKCSRCHMKGFESIILYPDLSETSSGTDNVIEFSAEIP